MNTIGLLIQRVSQGLTPWLTINDGPWAKACDDPRLLLGKYNTVGALSDAFATAIRYSRDGMYIAVIRPIPPRPGDCLAAWLFIPCGIAVEGREVAEILQQVKQQLRQPVQDENLLCDLFSKQYSPVTPVGYTPSPLSTGRYARRTPDSHGIDPLLDPNGWQSIYARYDAILIQTHDSLPITATGVDDLSAMRLVPTVIFPPPSEVPQGVTVHLADGTPFTTPMRVEQG